VSNYRYLLANTVCKVTRLYCAFQSALCTTPYSVVQCRVFSPQCMHFPIVWCAVYIHFAACSLTTNLQSTIPNFTWVRWRTTLHARTHSTPPISPSYACMLARWRWRIRTFVSTWTICYVFHLHAWQLAIPRCSHLINRVLTDITSMSIYCLVYWMSCYSTHSVYMEVLAVQHSSPLFTLAHTVQHVDVS
jgi:hypothetical protein